MHSIYVFGDPYQYNMNAQHDGFKNIYSIVKDGVKIIVSPSKSVFISKPFKRVKTLFVTCSEMKKLVDKVCLAYAFVVLEKYVEMNELPLELQHLHDIVCEEIPPELSPIKDI